MISDGIEHAVAICLAPQNSRTSVGLYHSSLTSNQGLPFTVDFVDSWHDHPFLIKAFAGKVADWVELRLSRDGAGTSDHLHCAQRVPERTIAEGDPYESQARQTASLVAREAALNSIDWAFAFQSQGMSGAAWLGPRVEDTILNLKDKGHRGVFLQPIGFLCDHVEVLYDIDIGFKQFADKQGMRLWRAESLNDSPLLAAALADIAGSRLVTITGHAK